MKRTLLCPTGSSRQREMTELVLVTCKGGALPAILSTWRRGWRRGAPSFGHLRWPLPHSRAREQATGFHMARACAIGVSISMPG